MNKSQATLRPTGAMDITNVEPMDDVEALIAALCAISPHAQTLPARSVAALARGGVPLVTQLVKFLTGVDDSALQRSLQALAQIGTPVLEVLETIFRQADDRVRQTIIEILSACPATLIAPDITDFAVQGALLLKKLGVPWESRNALLLHIEDDPLNRDGLRTCLYVHQKHYLVLGTGDGTTGLAMAAQLAPDLVLLDLNLPGTDGYEVLRQLKSAATTRNISVVACTAVATYEEQKRALDAGFSGLILKPLDIDLLPQQITQYLQGGPCQP